MTLEILFQDEHYIAINKPAGMLVHRSGIDRHETVFAMQLLRDQIGQKVFPLHRLDKPTSGVLLFGLSSEAAKSIAPAFENHDLEKTYLAVVRGYVPAEGTIDHALKEIDDKHDDPRRRSDKEAQSAVTHYRQLATIELAYAVDKYPQSRYSLVELKPQTGRRHQIRRHLKHISHPIIGDVNYGKGTHNRFYADTLNCKRLLLHASELEFTHPFTQQPICIKAPMDEAMQQLFQRFSWPQ